MSFCFNKIDLICKFKIEFKEIIKAKKWKIDQEKYLKMLYDKIKNLLLKNDKKRQLNSVVSSSESIASENEQDIIVLSQSPNKKGKKLKPTMSSNSHINENIQSTPGRGTKRKLSDITNKC